MNRKIITGDIETGGVKGVGNVSPAMVRERAIQLAVIDGRSEEEMNHHDLEQAEREFRDRENPGGEVRHDFPRELADSALAGDPTPSPGSQADNHPSFDQEIDTDEELVRQGMDEALHDEMLESEKRRLAEDQE